MYFGDKTDIPFYLGSGYAGNLMYDEPSDGGGLYLPESAIAKLPKQEKRELGFNATQVRFRQENDQRQHQDRSQGG